VFKGGDPVSEIVQYEEPASGVALIRLNRPEKLNAFSVELESALLAAVERACADEGVRVIVLSGAGRGFSGGWDLGESDLTAAPSLSWRAGQHTWLRVIRQLRRPDKLFIAAVHGWAAGQGLELCIASDLIVAAEDARFYFAEVRVGFNMTSGVAKLLPLLIGLGNAKRLALLGAKVDAQEAYRLGLAAEVTSAGHHEAAALRLAAEALQGAPLAVAAQKRLLDSGIEMSLSAAEDAEVASSLRLTYTEDHQEAKRAFAEKRAPQFRGR
jgi:2-(1,2-epoxy-1,2-dihydrophenyl)acetyl-CoA isomerase